MQETVISVARKVPDFRYDPQSGSFKQWLLLITRRRIHDHLRRAYRTLPSKPNEVRSIGAVDEVSSSALPPDAALDAAWDEEWRENIFQSALARVRQRVNPKHYQVFDYYVLQNMRPVQVAKMLGLNAAQDYLARHRVGAAIKRAAAEVEAESKRV